ncbi:MULTISPECIES: hypothetical protein [Crocosphaera]|uniref:Uncharacterized protein n=4 Tax=Crocosphaera watsonii TaxID=263511 RepID=T2JPH4_CROWT|nr:MULTISPECIES: hypothetical protein [Crocosphaera]MCH2245981.1 hypothetical protein [Crocosphaera sp.]NQZ61337.1 hypothetical protein [Crocosphaera sp.]CCQ52103.1 hypothetical protein CWATWH8502_3248 [Crocosphaera watsonii WH 8502]CCQ60059.1 hypothetical protein CWATWH0401_1572 [Crocosphaera watsonii WH 0401]CCQ66931.1 hypothetical protein CWATWH0402_1114 [Crocosphaera watsonii WH 0402]
MASLLGLSYVILGIIYIVVARTIWKSLFRQFLNPSLYHIQSLALPSFLIVIGLILLGFGWRLDPILQFAFFLQFTLLIYVVGKDKMLFQIMSNSKKHG